MSLERDVELLSQTEFFSSFNDEALRLLAFGGQRLNFKSGMELFHEGQTSDGGFILLSGNIRIDVQISETHIKSEIEGPGSLIGELALLTRNKRVGTATIIEDAEILKIRRDTLYRVLDEYPHLAANLRDKIVKSISGIGSELERLQERYLFETEIADS
ncbi:MAG: Crp/Fnr family transcriptional regulator [Pseudomonadota bacterium]